MKISFVSTVFNEENTIEALLTSLFKQSRIPDEILIVDANSTDNTRNLIENSFKEFKKFHKKTKTSLIVREGNRSVGRNEGISQATGEIIVISDAGCTIDREWVAEITKPFKVEDVDVVSGFYRPIATTPFQRALATYTCVMEERVNPEIFLPSSRSVAFKKTAWEKVGGYPKNLNTCEDLLFAKTLKRKGMKFETNLRALVYWPQRKTLKEAFKQFYAYAKGDGQARYFRPQTPLLFIRYFIAILLIDWYVMVRDVRILLLIGVLLIAYILWAIVKNFSYVKSIRAIYLLPMLQFTSDVAVLGGMVMGFLRR